MHSTQPSLPRRALTGAFLSLAAAALVGCASAPSATSAPAGRKADSSQEALVKRAQAYWDLVRVNDNIGAWAYEAQSKDPRWSLETYLKKGGITYKSVTVMGVKALERDTALLDVHMNYSLPMLRVNNKDARVEDQWKLIDGVWYHSPPRSALFPVQ